MIINIILAKEGVIMDKPFRTLPKVKVFLAEARGFPAERHPEFYVHKVKLGCQRKLIIIPLKSFFLPT